MWGNLNFEASDRLVVWTGGYIVFIHQNWLVSQIFGVINSNWW